MTKRYTTYIAASALLILGACSHAEPMAEEGGLSGLEQMEVPMVMSVLPESGSGTDIYDHGTQPTDLIARAECAINPASLYIGTFTTDGVLIDVLYNGGIPSDNPTGTVFFDHASWGPTISFTLNKETQPKYSSDFYIAAFAVPSTAGSFSFPTDGKKLPEPGLSFPEALKGKTWKEDDIKAINAGNSDVFIPMAGCMLIDDEWIEKTYNRDIYGVAPLQLPSIRMVRAVAKIVIEDLDGIITSATCTHNSKGNLFAYPMSNAPGNFNWWSAAFTDTPPPFPNVPSQAGFAASEQKLEAANATDPVKKDSNGDALKQYVFYAFEHDFTDIDADDEARALVTLTANGLPDKKIRIAPYTADGKELTGDAAAYSAISTRDGYAWTGLLRNHCYTYSVSKPANGEMQIYVKATKWDYERINFDF